MTLDALLRQLARTTMDVDAVIDPTPPQLESFVHVLTAAALYVSADAWRSALALPA